MNDEAGLTCDVLVVGGGPAGLAAARAARGCGADVVVVDEGRGDFVWGAFARDEMAAVIGGRSVVVLARRVVLAVRPVAIGRGRVADVGLARALGAACVAVGAGVLACVVDRDGRSSVPGVFVVSGLGSDRVARAQGRRAGRAAAGRVVVPGAPVLVRRRGVAVRGMADGVVVCPCEGVTAGVVRAARDHGAGSVGAVKRATRAGMGRCQGRWCGPALGALCGSGMGEVHGLAPRAPAVPVRIGAVMRDEAEPAEEPVAVPPFNRWVPGRAGAVPGCCDAVVIGGGVIGLCAARDLVAAGLDVVLLDRGEPGLGASTANAGSLHVQLVPYVFQEGSPGPLGEALALGPRSIALWREIALAAGEGLGIRTEGGLVLAQTEDELAWLGRKAAFERSRGVETSIVGAAELRGLAPAIGDGFAGAAFCPAEGQIDPLRAMAALVRLARAAGVRVVAGVGVTGLAREGSGWVVQVPGGVIRAGMVLNAAGAHAGVVGRLAGVRLPVGAVVQQVIATAPVAPVLRQLVAQVRRHLSLKQGCGGHMLIGGGWPGRLDADGATRLLRRSVVGNLAVAARAMPGLAGMEAVRAWTGLTVSLERGPVISGTPGMAGLFHAVTTNGFTLGPVAGRLAADAMLGRGAPPGSFALR